MDYIKEAFHRVKEDVSTLTNELNLLKEELKKTKQDFVSITTGITTILNEISEKITQIQTQKGKDVSLFISKKQEDYNENELIEQEKVSTHKLQNQTIPTHPSTHNLAVEGLKTQNMAISTGNEGVSTDRQTDRQTDTSTRNSIKTEEISIERAAQILDSLDSIKKELRLKFKRLTEQEILVFSTLYQIDEESGPTDYKTLSSKLNLTESSIRDYVGRLIKKGVPVEKKRINNKTIELSISKNLKKIASLSTILHLRDI